MTEGQLDPILNEFLDQLHVPANQKARLSNLSAAAQEAVLTGLQVSTVAGRLRRDLARVSAELKQVKDSRACLDQELKKVNRLLSAERQVSAKNRAQSGKVIARQKREIESLKKRKRLNNRDRKTFELRREEEKERTRERVKKHRLKRQYQELLARLTEFRRATQTRDHVIATGVSDVRTMCGRIKTEAQKLGRHVANPWDD